MTNRMSISRGLFPDTVGVELAGSATLSTSAQTVLTPLDTTATGVPSGKVFISSTAAVDDLTTTAVAEQLTETYIMPGAADPTPTVSTITVTSGATGASSTTVLATSFDSSDPVSILETDTAEQIATKLRALTLTGWTISGSGVEVIATSSTIGSVEGYPLSVGVGDSEGLVFTTSSSEAWGTDEGGARKENKSYIVGTVVGGDVLMYFNSASPVTVAILSTDSVAEAINKLVLGAPSGWTGLNVSDAAINFTCDTAEAHAIPMSIDFGAAITDCISDAYIAGVDASSGGLVPGDIEVFYNSATATLVTLDGTETLGDVYDKIALSVPSGYTATDDASIVILKTLAGANVIPLSIDLGSTGITVDTTTLIPGSDSVGDTGAWTVQVKGLNTLGQKVAETVELNGQTQVETTTLFSSVLSLEVTSAGTGKKNAGKIYAGTTGATAGKPNLGYCMIPIGYNKSVGATYVVPATHDSMVECINFFNPTASEVITVRLMSDSTVVKEMKVGAGTTSVEFIYPVAVTGTVSLTAQSTSTTPAVTANLSGLMIKKA